MVVSFVVTIWSEYARNLASIIDEIIKENTKCKIRYSKAKNELEQLQQLIINTCQNCWAGAVFASWSAVTLRGRWDIPPLGVQKQGSDRNAWAHSSVVFHYWNDSWRQEHIRALHSSAASRVPSQAGAPWQSLALYHCNLLMTIISYWGFFALWQSVTDVWSLHWV